MLQRNVEIRFISGEKKSLQTVVSADSHDSPNSIATKALASASLPFEFKVDQSDDRKDIKIVVDASEEKVAEQLESLLSFRELSFDELGLLYCYKHGVSPLQVLKVLDKERSSLQAFISCFPTRFTVNGSKVSKAEAGPPATDCVDVLVKMINELSPFAPLDLKVLSSKVRASKTVTLPLGVRLGDFLHKHADTFTFVGNGYVMLREAYENLPVKPLAPNRPAKNRDAAVSPTRQTASVQKPLATTLAPPPGLSGSDTEEEPQVAETEALVAFPEQNFQELHAKVGVCQSRAAQLVSSAAETIKAKGAGFLDIESVVKGGGIARGTAVLQHPDASLVIFVRGLPETHEGHWAPPLLNAIGCCLVADEESSSCIDKDSIEFVGGVEPRLDMTLRGIVYLSVRIVPTNLAGGSYEETLAAQGRAGPEARRLLATALVREVNQFVGRQPGPVKVTMKLLKWWRAQQQWSHSHTTPGDYLLEVLAAHAWQSARPRGQREAIGACLALMARLGEARIVPVGSLFEATDIWSPLLQQKPLIMDPVNPFINLADPLEFDCKELQQFATTTHFFW